MTLPKGSWLRKARVDEPESNVLKDLPKAGKDTGKIISSRRLTPGTVSVVAQVDESGAWLLIPEAWHPAWHVLVDEQPQEHTMLLPGWIGVPLEPGRAEVRLTWPVRPWRGVLGALSLTLQLLLLASRAAIHVFRAPSKQGALPLESGALGFDAVPVRGQFAVRCELSRKRA